MPSTHAGLPSPPLPGIDERWALFLDVDGCLLEFADDPSGVVVTTQLTDLLDRLHRRLDGAMALVSGRGLADLRQLFGDPPWTLAGLHGYELQVAGEPPRELSPDPAQQAHMRRAVRELASRLDGVQLEDKQHAIALHCRRAPDSWEPMLAAARTLADDLPGYELQPGNLVVEFKPAGVDKGMALEELLPRAPFAGRRPVYLGDDLTDEHAFAVANQAQGMSVRVGSREPTAARFTLSSPAAVHAWLDRVRDALEHPQHGVTNDADTVGGHPPPGHT